MAEQFVTLRQVRSANGRDSSVHGTLNALGLGRIGKEKRVVVNPAVQGMIRRVRHLVTVSFEVVQ